MLTLRKMLLLLVAVATSALSARAQSTPPAATPSATAPSAATPLTARSQLFQTIHAQDAALFHAYNTCDLKTLGSMVTEDLEFYHDVNGLATGRQVFVDSIRKYICGKVTRELVESSLEVYPLKGYGAVEMGTHRFHHPGQTSDDTGEARFVQLWQLKDGVWRLARVISYEHGPAK